MNAGSDSAQVIEVEFGIDFAMGKEVGESMSEIPFRLALVIDEELPVALDQTGRP